MNASAANLIDILQAAITACHPRQCLPAFLPELPKNGKLIVIGAGKAAGAMAATLETAYLDQGYDPASNRIIGAVATRHGYGCPTSFIPVHEAGHPVPDEFSVKAAQFALLTAANAGPNDQIITLLSGGASAIWCAPLPSITLHEQQTLTTNLLNSGMPISAINTIRKHISAIKGGRLAQTSNAGNILSLAISDVPGDIPTAIGSGPTLGDPTTLSDARAALKEYRVLIPESISTALHDPSNETPKPNSEIFQNNRFEIISNAKNACKAAAKRANELGYQTLILDDALQGEARTVAQTHANLILQKRRANCKLAVISGGELTVTIKQDHQKIGTTGKGGPNQEYLLALLMAFKERKITTRISALAADTDGSDGGQGLKNDPAGAFFTPETLKRVHQLNLNPAIFLANNDSSTFFAKLESLIVTGPTQTNVNDIRVILIEPYL